MISTLINTSTTTLLSKSKHKARTKANNYNCKQCASQPCIGSVSETIIKSTGYSSTTTYSSSSNNDKKRSQILSNQ